MNSLWMVCSDFGPLELKFLDYFKHWLEGLRGFKLKLNCCMLVNLVLAGMIEEKFLKRIYYSDFA